ncbi:MAG: ester cyclase [Thermomicrobiales bacterium]
METVRQQSAAASATLDNRQVVAAVFDECFNKGNVDLLPQYIAVGGHDHQHPDEADFVKHLSDVIVALRTAFPDLHFEIDQMIAEGPWVALHSVMTGTHLGPLTPPVLPPDGPRMVPPTGKSVRVVHMHMIRNEAGKGAELFHLMDTFAMLKQLGLLPGPPSRPA